MNAATRREPPPFFYACRADGCWREHVWVAEACTLVIEAGRIVLTLRCPVTGGITGSVVHTQLELTAVLALPVLAEPDVLDFCADQLGDLNGGEPWLTDAPS